jgi:uncharacterized UPF0160 family protein
MAMEHNLRSQRYLMKLYQAADDRRVLLAERVADVNGILADCPELLYVISPWPSGNWGILAVSTVAGSFASRRPFPESWRAQSPEMLAKLSGISDAKFCHATGFYAVTDSKEGALKFVQNALNT